MSDDFLRPMPCSNDAERAVLSCALQWPDCIGRILSQHGGERLFYIPANRVTWNALEKLHRERGEIDLITLTDELRRQGMLDQVGGPAHVAGLLDAVPSTQLLPQYLRSVSEDAHRREIIHTCTRVASEGYNPASKVEDLSQTLDSLTQGLFSSISSRRSRNFKAVILDTVELIHERMRKGGELPGLSYGIDALDEATNGMQGGQTIVVAGRPGLGKSSLAMNFGEHLANKGMPIAVFSIEMMAEQLGIRSLAARAELDSLKLGRGWVSKEEMKRLSFAVSKLADLPIWIDDRSDMRLIDIQIETRRLVKEHGIKLVIVDYLQLLRYPSDARNKEDAAAQISKGLASLAKELNIPIIVVSQLNRDSEKRAGGKPKSSDLRDSGQIEQDANVILLLHADAISETDSIIDMEIIVAKCRGGRLGSIPVSFHRPITTFKPRIVQ